MHLFSDTAKKIHKITKVIAINEFRWHKELDPWLIFFNIIKQI